MNSKKCNYNGCTNPVWSRGLCKNHTTSKPLNKPRLKGRKIHKSNVSNKYNRYNLFMILWKKRGAKSEISGQRIYGNPSSAHFHHILPKNKYPELDLIPENIIIMTIDEHNNVENDMYKYEEVNRRREILIKKYNLI